MSLKDDFKILLATGSRQEGKTTLLKALKEPELRYLLSRDLVVLPVSMI